MSLNKFTDSSVRKTWMNINANEVSCATLEADAVEIVQVDAERLVVKGDVLPQVVLRPDVGDNATLELLADECDLIFVNDGSVGVGRIHSSESTQCFEIDPEGRNSVRIAGDLELKRLAGNPSSPASTHISLFVRDDSKDVQTINSDGEVKKLAYFTSGKDALNLTAINGINNFNQSSPSNYSIVGDHVSIWGVFRGDPQIDTVDMQIDAIGTHVVVLDSFIGMYDGHKTTGGAISYSTLDTTYSSVTRKFQMLFGATNNVAVNPALNINTLFHYRLDYFIEDA